MCYFRKILILVVLAALAGCHSNNASQKAAPKFARWELDSLTEISPMTPVETEGLKGTHLAQKWSMTVMVDGFTSTEYPDGSSVTAPNQSEIDKRQYIDFKKDGSFELSVTESVSPELLGKIKELFGAEYARPGLHRGTYKCYDTLWSGSTCNGSYGVVLFDEGGKELCRYAFVYVEVHDEEFSLDKVEMKNPYVDDISSSISFYLYKQ